MKEMWISIKDRQPTEKVLAIGHQDELMIGYVGFNEGEGDWTCESGDAVLIDVYAYIPVADILKTVKGLK